MSIYNELLVWSKTKSLFIQDALRRIVSTAEITETDIDELIMLLKKEHGDTSVQLNAVPLDESHIPTIVDNNEAYPRLTSIRNAINICALYEQSELKFANTGLTVIYGNNGSGKSSYSRILRKLCWSRNTNITLKKNVFNTSGQPQEVSFGIYKDGVNINYTWDELNDYNAMLNSMYVFDNDCGNVYLNNENPVVYRPTGIDVLEKLIKILVEMNKKLDLSIQSYNTSKPLLVEKFIKTSIAPLYNNIENLTRNEVENIIQFSQEQENRRIELSQLLSSGNPQQPICHIINHRRRVCEYIKEIQAIEEVFEKNAISEVIEVRTQHEIVNQAYLIATTELNDINSLGGFGTNPWRKLWESAKEYAHNAELTDGQNFPSGNSLEMCVLCQQKLDSEAKARMLAFNDFILNDMSEKLEISKKEIEQVNSRYDSLEMMPLTTLIELEEYVPNIKDMHSQFKITMEANKAKIVNFINNGGILEVSSLNLTSFITGVPLLIDSKIKMYEILLKSRDSFTDELIELEARKFLYENKATILRYYNEVLYKSFLKHCMSQLNTASVSRKIGELMDTMVVSLQHDEFISHLTFFNKDLANKVKIAKTKTSQGSTYQKCGFVNVKEPISAILSEGEQKIIALSNFLAECTIDNRKNTIILDDPVTSLDVDYREKIAKKIVQLSQDRQVIVFTHDLYFLRQLIDIHKSDLCTECGVVGIDNYNGITGIITDEIPYLFLNVQERIDSIRTILSEHDKLPVPDFHGRAVMLDSARKRFRMLIERSVEELLSGRSYERFSKNVHVKEDCLSNYVVTGKDDVDFLRALFGKYSMTEHDGSVSTISQLPNKDAIKSDINEFSNWRKDFNTKLKSYKNSNNIKN